MSTVNSGLARAVLPAAPSVPTRQLPPHQVFAEGVDGRVTEWNTLRAEEGKHAQGSRVS